MMRPPNPCPRVACDGALIEVDPIVGGRGDRASICNRCSVLVGWERLRGDEPMPSERDPDWRPPPWWSGDDPEPGP